MSSTRFEAEPIGDEKRNIKEGYLWDVGGVKVNKGGKMEAIVNRLTFFMMCDITFLENP